MFEFCGVDAAFGSPQFEREWETGSGKQDGGFRLMDRAVRLPGLRALDRNFDRLPESLRWLVERIVHDPGRARRRSRSSPAALRERLRELLADDVARARADRRPRARLAITLAAPCPNRV